MTNHTSDPQGPRCIDLVHKGGSDVLASQNFTQVATIFGSGYMPEQHTDDTQRYLPVSDPLLNFDELLKKLRAALSLR